MLWLLLGVEVVEVAVKLVETVGCRQHVVAVTEMVLPELTGHVAPCPQERGDRRVFLLHALRGAGEADLREPRADWRLAGDERRATRGAALLAIPVGEERPLTGNAVDVRRLVAHHAMVVRTHVELADVIAPDDENVRLFPGLSESLRNDRRRSGQNNKDQRDAETIHAMNSKGWHRNRETAERTRLLKITQLDRN